MHKTLIVAAAALAGGMALPSSASASTIYCDVINAVEEQVDKGFGTCVDEPNTLDQAIRDLVERVVPTP